MTWSGVASDRPVVREGDGTDLFSKFDPLIAMRENLLGGG